MVKVSPAQRTQLQRVREAAAALKTAEAALQAEVNEASAADIPASHIADAAGIGRATLYRWIGRAES